MVPVTSLWLPVLLSAVLVFVASFLIHMLLPIHRGDIKPVRGEDEALAALRKLNIPPGDYGLPHAASMEAMKDPAYVEKRKAGPIVYMTVLPGGEVGMGASLVQWFLYSVVVSIFAGYLAGAALGPGAPYLEVFRFAGTTAFAGYALALPQNSIWWKRGWGMTLKTMGDGLVYGLLTGGAFGWLWPR
jgi:hypothetical protein